MIHFTANVLISKITYNYHVSRDITWSIHNFRFRGLVLDYWINHIHMYPTNIRTHVINLRHRSPAPNLTSKSQEDMGTNNVRAPRPRSCSTIEPPPLLYGKLIFRILFLTDDASVWDGNSPYNFFSYLPRR